MRRADTIARAAIANTRRRCSKPATARYRKSDNGTTSTVYAHTARPHTRCSNTTSPSISPHSSRSSQSENLMSQDLLDWIRAELAASQPAALEAVEPVLRRARLTYGGDTAHIKMPPREAVSARTIQRWTKAERIRSAPPA